MRILWSSNAIWAHTGYGVQAKYLLPRFKEMGHAVAQFAFYGLRGAKIATDGLLIYPSVNDDWGCDVITAHVADFKADVVVSLQDIWVMPENYRELVRPAKWVCWFPVDQDPPPPGVEKMSKKSDYPVVYSRHAHRAMHEHGLECDYIPHGVDVEAYCPGDKYEARARIELPHGAYIVTMVAANQGCVISRKAFGENLSAFAEFARVRPELDCRLYLHTDASTSNGGLDLKALAEALGITDRVIIVNRYGYEMGYPEDHMADLYRASDVLLASSMGEGFGIPIIEAQACGTPVITTDWTAMTELTINGIATKPAQRWWTPLNSWAAMPSVENITRALVDVSRWDDGYKRDRSACGVEHVRASYAWDVCMNQYWHPFLERVENDILEAKKNGTINGSV